MIATGTSPGAILSGVVIVAIVAPLISLYQLLTWAYPQP